MERHETIIIGGGLAGISTALHLDRPAPVLEMAQRAGGLCVSHRSRGYTFDITGHWLHLRDPEITQLVLNRAPMEEIVRVSQIWSFDRLTDYPFQANLRGLPEEVIVECLEGAIKAHVWRSTEGDVQATDFGEHVLRLFGDGIARHFMFPYNTKLWGVPPAEISTAWCQRFVPVPDLRGILEGAFTDRNQRMGYNASFRYPAEGGIGTFTAALASDVEDLRCGMEVRRIHLSERWLETSSGARLGWDNLVSTMPLPTLAAVCEDGSAELKQAGERLRATKVDYLDLGIRSPVLSGNHWIYVPDPDSTIYRLGCYSNAMPSMAPEGCSSLYVELRNDRPVDAARALDDTLAILSGIGPSVSREQVEVCDLRSIPCAYVIYDHEYQTARARCLEELERHNVQSTGRYGGWVYSSMEDALLDGRTAARRIIEERVK